MKMPSYGLHDQTGSSPCLQHFLPFPPHSALATLVLLQAFVFLLLLLGKLFSGFLHGSVPHYIRLSSQRGLPGPLWVRAFPYLSSLPPSLLLCFLFLLSSYLPIPYLALLFFSLLHIPLMKISLFTFSYFSFNLMFFLPMHFLISRESGICVSCSLLYLECLQHCLACSRQALNQYLLNK